MGTIQNQIAALRESIAAAQTQIDSLSSQLCQVSGTLFNDTDADGTRDTGETVTGVRKILLQPGNVIAESDSAGRYAIANLDPGNYAITRPDFPAGYRLSNPTVPGGATIDIALHAGEHRTIDIGTTNRPINHATPVPVAIPPLNATQVGSLTSRDVPSPSAAKPKWPSIGACITLAVDAKDDATAAATAARAQMLGLSHLRAFGPSCQIGGKVDTGFANQVRRLTSRGLRVIVMHGAPESDPVHTTFAEDDWKRYFDTVAAARRGDALYEIELQNEFNLARYWPLGGGAALSAPAVAKMMAVTRIARAAFGPSAIILGPSIGYDAEIAPHLQYQKALLDGGLLDCVSAINTHLYFAAAQQIADVLGQYRDWVGPAVPIVSTEANCPASVGRYADAATTFVAAVRAAGVMPCIYRLVPRGGSSWDDRCLFDASGAKNAVVAGAWF